MNFQQVRHPIDSIIQWIRAGKLGLPDFQRDFVWSPTQVAELLDSVARQWPIGSLLLLNGPQPFAFREIDSAPKLASDSLDLYVLDGQQRITALYHAVTNTSKYCYYIDFHDLKNGGTDPVKWSARKSFERQYQSIADRASAGIALISDIWEQPKFFNWLGLVLNDTTRMEFLEIRDEKIPGLQSKVYHMMALELEQGIGLEALARIFETINRTGVALNAFDLLVAKLYPTGFNLREKWDEAMDVNPVLRHFQPNELEVLKLISLLIRRKYGKKASQGVRQGDLLALESRAIIEFWDEGIEKYVIALETAISFGIVSRDLIPSWSMIIGLAGCIETLTSKETFTWWKNSIIRQTFAQAANTKIVAEFDSGMLIGNPLTLDQIHPEEILSKTVKSNGLLSNGIFGLIIKMGGRDPITGLLLAQSSDITLKKISNSGVISKISNEDTLANVILFSEGSNRSIKKGDHIDSLKSWKDSLRTQHINSVLFIREPHSLFNIFAS